MFCFPVRVTKMHTAPWTERYWNKKTLDCVSIQESGLCLFFSFFGDSLLTFKHCHIYCERAEDKDRYNAVYNTIYDHTQFAIQDS